MKDAKIYHFFLMPFGTKIGVRKFLMIVFYRYLQSTMAFHKNI